MKTPHWLSLSYASESKTFIDGSDDYLLATLVEISAHDCEAGTGGVIGYAQGAYIQLRRAVRDGALNDLFLDESDFDDFVDPLIVKGKGFFYPEISGQFGLPRRRVVDLFHLREVSLMPEARGCGVGLAVAASMIIDLSGSAGIAITYPYPISGLSVPGQMKTLARLNYKPIGVVWGLSALEIRLTLGSLQWLFWTTITRHMISCSIFKVRRLFAVN